MLTCLHRIGSIDLHSLARGIAGLLLLVATIAAGPVRSQEPEFAATGPEGERICLSLRELARRAAGDELPPEAETLAGMNWVDGFLVDDSGQDVVLLGRVIPGRPKLHLDDLVVNMRNTWNRDVAPYCSLDPRPEDILASDRIDAASSLIGNIEVQRQQYRQIEAAWGGQTVVVGGVPRESRVAHTMIDADYLMKKLAQGLVSIDGLQSQLDMLVEDFRQSIDSPRRAYSAPRHSRVWFHLDRDPTYSLADRVIRLDGCRLVASARGRDHSADGAARDAAETDLNATIFARSLSDNMTSIAAAMPVFADLENIFRLRALVTAMHFGGAVTAAALDLDFWLRRYHYRAETPMPATLPGLTNARETRVTRIVGDKYYDWIGLPHVCGGVTMGAKLDLGSFTPVRDGSLVHLRKRALRSRPDALSLWWPLPANDDS